jgi:hypothetical protein
LALAVLELQEQLSLLTEALQHTLVFMPMVEVLEAGLL